MKLKFNSINFKLIVTISVLLLSVFLAITIVGIQSMTQIIKNMGGELFKNHLQNVLNQVNDDYDILENTGFADVPGQTERTQKEILAKINKMRFKKTGYIFIFNSQKKLMTHPNLKKGDDLSNLAFIQKIMDQKAGKQELRYIYNNETKYCVYTYFKPWDWYMGLTITENELFAERWSFIKTSLIIMFAALCLTVIIIFFILRKLIINPVYKTLDTLKYIIQERDLTKKIAVLSRDEMGDLAEGFNHFLEEIGGIIYKVKQSSHIVIQSGLDLSNSMEVVRQNTKDIAASIHLVAEHTHSQSDSVKNTYKTINELIQAIENVSKGFETHLTATLDNSAAIEEMNASISSVDDIAKKANDVSMNLTQVAREGESSIKDAIKAIKEIDASSQLVTEIVQVIGNIAEQTNLLAMNAAIEAAHAGIHGKGFAVVADEVRKLAESSSNSSREIIGLIQDMSLKIENGVKLANFAEHSLTNIIIDIRDTTNLISEISSAMSMQKSAANSSLKNITSLVIMTDDINKSVNREKGSTAEIAESMTYLQDMSSQIASITEEHLANIGEIAEAMNMVAATTKNNREKAQELEIMVSLFKINEQDQATR